MEQRSEFMELHISASHVFICFLLTTHGTKGDLCVTYLSNVSSVGSGRAWMAADCRSCRMLIAMPLSVSNLMCRTHVPGLALVHLAPCAEVPYRAPPYWERTDYCISPLSVCVLMWSTSI